MEWSWREWECIKSDVILSDTVILPDYDVLVPEVEEPETLHRSGRQYQKQNYHTYDYNKIYDEFTDGCNKVLYFLKI